MAFNQPVQRFDHCEAYSYPFARERELRKRILADDAAGARRALSQWWQAVAPARGTWNSTTAARLKSDALQLAVVLVRKTFQAGAPVEAMLYHLHDVGRQLADARSPAEIAQILERLVSDLVEMVNSAKRTGGQEALDRVLAYVQAHYNKDLSLEEVAEVANLSYFYLSRLFSRAMGIPFQEYLTRLRIAAAKELLLETNLTVHQVARQVGYQDASHFSRTFKQHTGMTPRTYARVFRDRIRTQATAKP